MCEGKTCSYFGSFTTTSPGGSVGSSCVEGFFSLRWPRLGQIERFGARMKQRHFSLRFFLNEPRRDVFSQTFSLPPKCNGFQFGLAAST
jgi:hypothetical protein